MATSVMPMTAPILPEVKSTAFSGTEGVYMLPHHAQEINRLQRQHRFMKSTTDGVQLVVPLSTHETLQVLDCGCADGTWLLDLKTLHPQQDWELHGVDIGSALFPKLASSQALDLREHDLKQPFPASWGWSNYFDVIHQRLLIWGLPTAAWPLVLRNQLAALKPGGWIQLVEAEWIDEVNPHSLPELQRQSALQKWSTETFGMDIHIAYKLESLLGDAGFIKVQKTQFDHGYGAKARSQDQQDASAELWVECFRSLDAKMPPGGIPGVAANPQDFHDFLDRLEVEIKTFGYQPKLNMVVAQKPDVEVQ